MELRQEMQLGPSTLVVVKMQLYILDFVEVTFCKIDPFTKPTLIDSCLKCKPYEEGSLGLVFGAPILAL